MITKSFRQYKNELQENAMNTSTKIKQPKHYGKDYIQKAFHTEIQRYSNPKDNIGRVFICVDTNIQDNLPLGIIGECIETALLGKYLKFHFDKNNFYNAKYFRELRNTFGYTAEELREIEWIEGCKIVDIENNLFTKDFLNSPLSSSALKYISNSVLNEENKLFIKNFDQNNSYHRLVVDLMK